MDGGFGLAYMAEEEDTVYLTAGLHRWLQMKLYTIAASIVPSPVQRSASTDTNDGYTILAFDHSMIVSTYQEVLTLPEAGMYLRDVVLEEHTARAFDPVGPLLWSAERIEVVEGTRSVDSDMAWSEQLVSELAALR